MVHIQQYKQYNVAKFTFSSTTSPSSHCGHTYLKGFWQARQLPLSCHLCRLTLLPNKYWSYYLGLAITWLALSSLHALHYRMLLLVETAEPPSTHAELTSREQSQMAHHVPFVRHIVLLLPWLQSLCLISTQNAPALSAPGSRTSPLRLMRTELW